ncbi:tail protein X [Enterobacter bugandensis]|nr:tail protein X [Enterobacter bugandensis]
MKRTTKDGDILDKLCHEIYGFTDSAFESVLYDFGNYDITTIPVFDAGRVIEFNVKQPEKKKTEKMLWE